MVNFDRGLTIRREIDRVLNQHRVEVQVVMEFDNIETIKRAIEIDAGVGLLPLPTVRTEANAKTLHVVELSGYPLVRPIGIIHRRGKDLSQSAVRFIDLLRESAAGGESPSQQPSAGNQAGEKPTTDDREMFDLDVALIDKALADTAPGERAVSDGLPLNDSDNGDSNLLESSDGQPQSRQTSKQVPR